MSLTHRPVEEKDIRVVCGFPQSEDELFFMFPKAEFPLAEFPLTPAQLQEAIAQRSDSTVAELDGEVAAFANFHRRETGGRCSLGNVIISPSARRRGVGRYLIARMAAITFSKHRATELTASCFNQNIAGLRLYSKPGFGPYAIKERKDRQGNRGALIHPRLAGMSLFRGNRT
ncbi:MAG: GNAT family N-acetyltransferase [Candidatus Accumulibacter sp.]|jgi:RimJ/RimL family protein N-acetyltransferase|nr:GNAT family N-acetyltransferase [Accumulibacter sp.]